MTSALDMILMVSIVVGAPLAFVGLWVGVCSLLAAVGGWRKLATRYRGVGPGPSTVSTTGILGTVRYKGTLALGASPAGLDLSVMLLFRAGHPTLRIPWTDIRVEGEKRQLFGSWTQVRLGQGGPLLQVPSQTWQRLTQAR